MHQKGLTVQVLKYDRWDVYDAMRVNEICSLHIPAIEALIVAGENDQAYDKTVGLATYYHPRTYEILSTLYHDRRNWEKYWPALVMSGAWPHKTNFLIHQWMTKHSKNGPTQLRSRFPTCFRSRCARPLMPLRVVDILFQFDFFVFPKRRTNDA